MSLIWSSIWSYVRQQHLGLLALVLVLGGGTAYAAKVHLPKNSVASKQVRNGSLSGADLKDGSVTGADIGDGSLTGSDLADGSIGRRDLARGAVRETQLVVVEDPAGGGAATVFSDPSIGTVTFACGGPQTVSIFASLPATATPGSVTVFGTDALDNNPVNTAVASQPTPGTDGGGAGYNGTTNLLPQGTVYYDTATKRMSMQWESDNGVSCTLRGEIVVQDKPIAIPATARHLGRHAVCAHQDIGFCRSR
jgi:hypothetical protein